MKSSDNNKFDVDFSKMDASIKDLLDAILKNELDDKNTIKEQPKKIVKKKKLNVELIRQLLINTNELQKKKQENRKKNATNNKIIAKKSD